MRRAIIGCLPVIVLGCGSAAPPAAPAKPVATAPAVAASPPATTPRFAAKPLPAPEFDDPDRAKKIAALVATLDKHVDDFFTKNRPPALAVAMVADGKIVYSRMRGVRDKASKAPLTERTLFRIGSITKTFTTSLILSLRDEGRIRLDEPAETYLPELAWVEYPFKDAPRITIRHLLTHTSGLPRLGDFDYTAATDVALDVILDALHRAKLERAPGTGFEYSNFGMSLLGEIIARVAPERSLRAALAKRLTEPLGLTQTAFDPSTIRDAELATGYAAKDDEKAASLWHLGASEASGGLWSSTPDMARWVAVQLDAWPPREAAESGFLKRATLREAHVPTFAKGFDATVENDRLRTTSKAVGLGWHTLDTCEYERIVWHNGGIDGFSSDIGFAPERGFGFVVLASSLDTPTDDLQNALFDAAASVLGPRKPAIAPETREALERLATTTATCSEADYNAIFTKSFRSAVPLDLYRAICQSYSKAHGKCRFATPVAMNGPRQGKFALACEHGGIEASAWVAEEDGHGKFSGLFMHHTGLAPSAEVVRAAREALLLESRWDANRYKAIFAAKVDQNLIKVGLETIRAGAGSCRLGRDADKHGGDGDHGAVLDVDCDKGPPAEVDLGLDDKGKIEHILIRPRSAGEHSKERCTGPTPKK